MDIAVFLMMMAGPVAASIVTLSKAKTINARYRARRDARRAA